MKARELLCNTKEQARVSGESAAGSFGHLSIWKCHSLVSLGQAARAGRTRWGWGEQSGHAGYEAPGGILLNSSASRELEQRSREGKILRRHRHAGGS